MRALDCECGKHLEVGDAPMVTGESKCSSDTWEGVEWKDGDPHVIRSALRCRCPRGEIEDGDMYVMRLRTRGGIADEW